MEKTVGAFSVRPGKDARAVAAVAAHSPDGYVQSRRGLGVHLERVYEQATPMGVLAIAYLESDQGFAETTTRMARSALPFDRDFLAAAKDVHGFDPAQPPMTDPPELLGDWVDEKVSERRAGLAFCAPIRPDAAHLARIFAKEAFEARVDEHAASRRALGVTHETVMLHHTPAGGLICVYLEGDDPVVGNREFAASRSEYDAWFKEQWARIFVPEVDFDHPLPPVTEIFDSREYLDS